MHILLDDPLRLRMHCGSELLAVMRSSASSLPSLKACLMHNNSAQFVIAALRGILPHT